MTKKFHFDKIMKFLFYFIIAQVIIGFICIQHFVSSEKEIDITAFRTAVFILLVGVVTLIFGVVLSISYRMKEAGRLEHHRKQTELMALQMIWALTEAIEEKDEYAKGHSHRVAEYSELIAKELGWSKKEAGAFISDVMDAMNKYRDATNIDFLTGLPMRNLGERQISQSMKEHPGCLAFLDMDNLKKINDIYGHKSGDRVLKLLGRIISDSINDFNACRFGGDEFLAFFPDITKETAEEVMKKIFHTFYAEKENDAEIRDASLSCGLCMCLKGESFADCYAKADQTLYYIKQSGKNGFSFYHQMEQADAASEISEKDLGKIAKSLYKSGRYEGALELDNREFSKIYEYMGNLGKRYEHTCHLVMITMEAASKETMDVDKMEQAIGCMEASIYENVRNVDIYTRYSSMQFLVILMEAGTENIPFVMDRIFYQYYKRDGNNDFRPRYEVIPMFHGNESEIGSDEGCQNTD